MAAGLVAKLLLGFLVLTFALWGIGDIFRSGSEAVVATVDGEAITSGELQGLIEMLQRNYPEITAEMSQDPRFKTEALNNLINNRLLRAEAQALGLSFASETLAGYIARNPAFQTKDGEFNRDVFIETLKQNNFSERAYLTRFSEDLSASFIENTLTIGWLPSEAMLGLYHFIRGEQREATLILLSNKDIPSAKPPSAKELKALYDKEHQRFMEPERRSFRYVSFEADTIWKQLKLDADEETLKGLYEERKDSMKEPERRAVDQLLFMNEDSAKNALEMLKDGKDWKEVAKLQTVMNRDSMSLGDVAMTDLPTEAATEVFSLEANTHSNIIKTGFGWHIFHVGNITAEHQKSFEEAKEQLNKDYRAEASEQKMSELAANLEDALAGGSTLEEALEQTGLKGLKPRALGPLSTDGKDAKEQSAKLSTLETEALQAAFTLDENETSGITLASDSHYYLLQTLAIEPAAAKPIDSVRPQLEKLFAERAQQQALHKRAGEVAKLLKEAENPSEAAKELGLSLHSSGKLTRLDDSVSGNSQLKDKVLTSGFIMELFRLKKHETTAPYPIPDGEYVIGILNEIEPAKDATDEELSELEKEFTATLANETMQHYFGWLRQKYDVEIKAEALYGTPGENDNQ